MIIEQKSLDVSLDSEVMKWYSVEFIESTVAKIQIVLFPI